MNEYTDEQLARAQEVLFKGKTDEELGVMMAQSLGLVPELTWIPEQQFIAWKKLKAAVYLDMIHIMWGK